VGEGEGEGVLNNGAREATRHRWIRSSCHPPIACWGASSPMSCSSCHPPIACWGAPGPALCSSRNTPLASTHPCVLNSTRPCVVQLPQHAPGIHPPVRAEQHQALGVQVGTQRVGAGHHSPQADAKLAPLHQQRVCRGGQAGRQAGRRWAQRAGARREGAGGRGGSTRRCGSWRRGGLQPVLGDKVGIPPPCATGIPDMYAPEMYCWATTNGLATGPLGVRAAWYAASAGSSSRPCVR
jgi:hypothetical protein